LYIVGDETCWVIIAVAQGNRESIGNLAAPPQDDMGIGDDKAIALQDGSSPDATLTVVDLD
jgi:hypothetical protein